MEVSAPTTIDRRVGHHLLVRSITLPPLTELIILIAVTDKLRYSCHATNTFEKEDSHGGDSYVLVSSINTMAADKKNKALTQALRKTYTVYIVEMMRRHGHAYSNEVHVEGLHRY